jgi:tetratricopeptide (TPR) repeat protein
MGMEVSREAALFKIEKAAAQGEYSSTEAQKIFVYISLWIEGNPKPALKYSRNLKENFPNNYFFGILFLECLIQAGNDREAEILFGTLEEELKFLTPIQQGWYFSYYRYELALFHFIHGDDDKSLLYVEEAINRYHAELDIVLSNAWLLKGMIHDKRENRDKARQAYTACIRLDNHSAAIKRARQYLQSPFVD